jgi:hypothetical protein
MFVATFVEKAGAIGQTRPDLRNRQILKGSSKGGTISCREGPEVCRLVWEFFCQVVFCLLPVPCLERKGRSSSRRLRSGSRSARKVSRDRNASAA